ncbi:GGDEF domain-containing protein [Methylomarinum vadi]|uniref:GGDEF domain-containing protein n=1 Tax=Methylomarinum vadi TaxID=438855 RepID=UPI00068DEDFC|nr:diguanylate cyclase [Methylomarinum vadi]
MIPWLRTAGTKPPGQITVFRHHPDIQYLYHQLDRRNRKRKKRTELYAQNLEEKAAERTRHLEQLTKLDLLTNLFNHRAMQGHLKRELLITKRRQNKLFIIYFDVDDFMTINDKEGHLQGDEFCIILPECDIPGSRKIC